MAQGDLCPRCRQRSLRFKDAVCWTCATRQDATDQGLLEVAASNPEMARRIHRYQARRARRSAS